MRNYDELQRVNNRFLRHLLFWLIYATQATLIEYAWIHDMYKSESEVIRISLEFSLSLLAVKMTFVYLVLEVFIKQALSKRKEMNFVTAEFALALIVTIICHRLIGNYLIVPTLHPERKILLVDGFTLYNIFISILDIGYVSGIAVALKLFVMQIDHLRNEKDLVKDKLETELKFLKNQINPHFLFNTLNNIYGLARKKSDKAPEVVMRLSKLLRFMLYESGKDTIPIADEIRILEDYMQLEKIRYNARLKLSFDQQIDDMGQLITPLILLPFIENAFKHGVSETTDDTRIDIRVTLKTAQLHFIVNNSQNGHHDNDASEKIGLANVRRQLELMYRSFSLDVTKLDDSFNVDLRINLNSHATI